MRVVQLSQPVPEAGCSVVARYSRARRHRTSPDVQCRGKRDAMSPPEQKQTAARAQHGHPYVAELTGDEISTPHDERGGDPDGKWFLAGAANQHYLSRRMPMKNA